MTKNYFVVCGSCKSFMDIRKEFDTLTEAVIAYTDMVNSGVRHAEVSEVTEDNSGYYSKSIKCALN